MHELANVSELLKEFGTSELHWQNVNRRTDVVKLITAISNLREDLAKFAKSQTEKKMNTTEDLKVRKAKTQAALSDAIMSNKATLNKMRKAMADFELFDTELAMRAINIRLNLSELSESIRQLQDDLDAENRGD